MTGFAMFIFLVSEPSIIAIVFNIYQVIGMISLFKVKVINVD